METRNRMLGEGVKLKSAEFLIIIQWHKKCVFFTSSLKGIYIRSYIYNCLDLVTPSLAIMFMQENDIV